MPPYSGREPPAGDADRERALRAREEASNLRAERAPIALMQLDARGECCWVNERWCALTGLSSAQALGLGFQRALHLEDREHVLRAWRDAHAAQAPLTLELRLQHSDGRERYVLSDRVDLRSGDGELLGTSIAMTDIAQRAATERRYRLLFEQSSEANLFLDESGTVIGCNRATLQLMGAQHEQEVVGQNLFSLSPECQPDGRSSLEKGRTMHAVCRLRGSHRFAWVHRNLSGEDVPVEISMTCLQVEGRQGFIVAAHDQTERMRAQHAIVRSREAALEALRAKSQFLANMSHEIRTPMNGVLGMLQLALDTALDDEQRDLLTTAHSSASGLLSILDDILDVAKLEAGKVTLETIPVALETVLRDTLRVLALRAHAKQLELVLELERDVPLHMLGDPGRLRQILTNLLGNAIKFTERGEIVLAVFCLRGADGAPLLGFRVRDTGIGISSESQSKVFERFAQADGSTTRRYGGTGLGLTITRDLVKLMGGALHVQSAPGVGSTFGFELPLRVIEPTQTEPTPGDGERVLIIEDNAAARHALTLLVERLGFAPVAVASLAEAIACVRESPGTYHAALVDDTLRGEEPRQFAALLEAELGACPLRPVLLQSHDPARAHAVRPTFPAKLQKPVLPSELRRALSGERLNASVPAPAPVTFPPKAPLRALRVLLVEDHPVNTHFLSVLLGRQGHQVVHAANGALGVAAFQAGIFDVILMDVQMPVMDGVEAARRIRALEGDAGRRVPIVGLSAHVMKEDADACLAAGMDRYLTKPVKAELLIELLNQLGGAAPASFKSAAPAPLGAEASGRRALDADALCERACGDRDFMLELLRIFRRTQGDMIDALARSMSAGDPDEVRRDAHRLAGALREICAHPAGEAATRLERAAHARTELAGLYATLTVELALVDAALHELGSS